MKTCLNIIYVLVIVCMLNLVSRAQDLSSALTKYSNAATFEKAYVQFDNSRYIPGQTIWYKAYLLSGFQPSLISKNFYIDWYNDKGQLISSGITPVVYGYSSGSFTLPEKYNGTFIRAVGYTKWMRNFESAYFYQQTFPIISDACQIEKKELGLSETTVQFLPESGTVLSNKLNVFAFKAVNKFGLPVNISGIVKNSGGDSITSFKSIHDGMGKFQMINLANEKYMVEWKDLAGNTHKTDLPLSEEVGVNLIVEPGRLNRVFHVQRTTSVPERMKQLTLVGQMNGNLLFKANLNLLDKESVTSSLPINKLLSGILQLTIFDANLQPLCERVLFVKNEDYILNASIQVDSLNTVKRGKNIFEIELKDSSYTNLSLSITDARTNDFPGNTIISQLLLKGDLAGNIYMPAYYFESGVDSVNSHLDLVMLTNGWRRYKWREILNNALPTLKYSKDSAYQSIKGKIINYTARKGSKTESINLIFVAKDSSSSMLTLPIMEDGSFSGNNTILYDTTKVYYKINGATRISKDDLTLSNDLFKANPNITQNNWQNDIDTTGLSRFLYLMKQQKKLDSLKQKATLKEVVLYAKEKTRMKELDAIYAKGIFSGEATAAFDMSSLQNTSHTQSIFDFLTGKVPELSIGNTLGGTATEGVVTFRRGAPTFYLDEIPILTSEANNIDINNVAYIKVFNPPFAGGFNASGGTIASGGAIAIYTRRGGDVNPNLNNLRTNKVDYKILTGYSPVKEFYSPNYAETEQTYSNVDLRSTLLWKPWIVLDKSHQRIKYIFYNNDVTHSFRLILEGMDSKGKLVHISKLLK